MARIVLIDDEARLLETLARFLELQGHQVVKATGFAGVQEHLYPGRFEVLVTDIVMPEFTGLEVLREVVEVRRCQEPVLLVTGEPNLETASEAVRCGAFDYIQKPVTKDRLLEAVGRGLRHVKLLRERDQARVMEMQLLKNLAALGESASVLTHEIRTPITSLRHALRAVGDKLGVDDRVLIEELVGNLNRIERLLGETLSFAKPLVPALHATSLAELVARVEGECRTLPAFGDTSIATEIAPGLQLQVDGQLFGEVISNLLRNAVEATGGKGHVAIHARCDGGSVVVEVVDDGPGVPASLRAEIFRPFRSSKEYGTGIGLAFCRKVVEAHGGTIELVARPGEGACFRIELPCDGKARPACRPGATRT